MLQNGEDQEKNLKETNSKLIIEAEDKIAPVFEEPENLPKKIFVTESDALIATVFEDHRVKSE